MNWPIYTCAAMKRHSIRHNDQFIDYEITHRPAVTRRIHLEIDEAGELKVVAPKRMSRRAIQKTLQQRASHVARFLVRARSRQQDLVEFRYVSAERHLFMGQSYPLEIREQGGKRSSVVLSDGQILMKVPELTEERVRRTLANWYRQRAQQLFSARLDFYSQAATWTGGQAPPMRLRLMKRTWGSCSSKGMITLNPHLVKAPPECIDYVIAHEICHLKEHNHGKSFYALQEQLYPAWRASKTRLHNNGHIYLHM